MSKTEQLLELANKLKGVLREDQLERILRIAPSLNEENSAKLFTKLSELQEKNLEKMKHEIDIRQRMQGAFEAHQKQNKAAGVRAAEAQERVEADVEAERLLEELNNLE